MAFVAGQTLTAAQLNDLSIDSLDVSGNITLSGEIDGPSDFTVSNGQGEGIEFSQTDNATHLKTLGSDRLTVNSSGDVGIGTTSPNSLLQVAGTSRVFNFQRDEDVAGGSITCGIMRIGTDATNPGTGDYWILFRKGDGTTIGSVRGTGSASVNFATTSDSTLKTDRGLASPSRIGTIIDGLQVHEFDWNEGDVTDQIGLFAQEAINVLPESIVNAPTTMPADEEGEDDQYVPAALDYSKIVPILIAECQFLRQRVAALEAP